jgi:hypothetical protein
MRRVFTFLIGSTLVILAATLIAAEQDRREFETAKAEYEQSSHDEAARVTYVTKLAQVADRLVSEYRGSGQRNDELMGAINSEFQKHPAPKDIDAKKLRQLLVGKWESPGPVFFICAALLHRSKELKTDNHFDRKRQSPNENFF